MQNFIGENLINNAKSSLIKAQIYCDVIKEILEFLDAEPFSNDILFTTLENDISKFIFKQELKLDKLLNERGSCDDNKI